jgi:hypothetical protein
VSDEVLMTEDADGACRVGRANKRVLDIVWRRLTPHGRRRGFRKQGLKRLKWWNPDAVHASTSGVASTDMGRFGRNDFSYVSWASAQAVGSELGVGELVVDGLCELDSDLVLRRRAPKR